VSKTRTTASLLGDVSGARLLTFSTPLLSQRHHASIQERWLKATPRGSSLNHTRFKASTRYDILCALNRPT
jgi:hypothetical protein